VHGEEGLEQLGDFFDRRDLGSFRLTFPVDCPFCRE